MIAKTTQGKSFKNLVYYCLQEKKNAVILDMNGLSRTDPKGLIKEFEAITCENSNISKPVWHTSISFSENDNVNPEKMTEIAIRLLEKLGFTRDNNQFLLVQHQDKEHKHLHIVCNRIGFDASVVSDYYCKKKVVKATKELEIEYGFQKIEDITKEKSNSNQNIRKTLISVLDDVLKKFSFQSFLEMTEELNKYNVQMKVLKHSNNGNEYGVTFLYNETEFKGSELGKLYALQALKKRFNQTITKQVLISNKPGINI